MRWRCAEISEVVAPSRIFSAFQRIQCMSYIISAHSARFIQKDALKCRCWHLDPGRNTCTQTQRRTSSKFEQHTVKWSKRLPLLENKKNNSQRSAGFAVTAMQVLQIYNLNSKFQFFGWQNFNVITAFTWK